MMKNKEEISNTIKNLKAFVNVQRIQLKIKEVVSPGYKVDKAIQKRSQIIQRPPHIVLLSYKYQATELLYDAKNEKINYYKKTKNNGLYKAMIRMRQRSEKLFKNLITTQINYNECLNLSHDRE